MRSRSPLAWLGGLLAIYLAVPIAAFFVRLPSSHQRGFNSPGLWSALRTSVESATIATAAVAVLGVPLAFALVRYPGRLSSAVGVIVALPLALPPVMSGILIIYMIGPYTTIGRFFHGRLTGSVAGIVLSQVFVAAPFLIISARSAFAAVDPSLDDLAVALGHRPLARFFRVDLLVAQSGIRAGLLLTWLRAIGEYGANVIVAYHPYSLPVFTYVQFSQAGIPTTQAPTVLVMAAAAAAVLLFQVRVPARRILLPAARPPAARAPVPVAFDLDLRRGDFHLALTHRSASSRLAILGPSGSGKSLTLRSLAGLFGPGAGAVEYGGEAVARIPTERRALGYVPQGQTLLPHLTVAQQVTFAVGADPALARWWLDTLGLAGLEARRPGELSGGQRQRVSLAAALSRDPRLVLLDEPFSALDTPVREELRREVRRLQRSTGLSTVLVTHDPDEAALLADEVVVISAGRMLQAGPVADVFRTPASPEVARLLGVTTILPGRVAAPGVLSVEGHAVPAEAARQPPGTEVRWAVRPDHVSLGTGEGLPVKVVDAVDLGRVHEVTVRLGRLELLCRAPAPPPGLTHMRITVAPADVLVWDLDGDSSG